MNRLNLFVGTAHAQTLSQFQTLLQPNTSTTLSTANIVTFVVNVLLLIAGLAAFIYLILAGFNYITAGGDADKATKARTAILNAIIGIVVVVLAYAIIRYATTAITGSVTGGSIQ